tara:strand:- start:71 stop:715 length:645 start_codon:yes stop_codon:yes gene_type:complete
VRINSSKEKKMKSIKTIILLLSLFVGLSAKNYTTIFGGTNIANVKYNSKDIHNLIDPENIIGYRLGFEKTINFYRLGLTITQRGHSSDKYLAPADEYTAKMNYLTGYVCLPFRLHEGKAGIDLFVGLEAGHYMKGSYILTVGSESERVPTNSGGIAMDCGLLLGIDSWYNDTVGFRLAYLLGLTNIDDNMDYEDTGYHKGIIINLLYRIKSKDI